MAQIRFRSASHLALSITLLVGITGFLNNSTSSAATAKPFVVKSICGATGKNPCKVGQIGPGGGTIFFVDYHQLYSSFDYLEAAPDVWAGVLGVDPTSEWCSNTDTKIELGLNAWSSRAIGLGLSNTKTMLANCSSGAANLIATYNSSAYAKKRDWFLPSIGEIILMSNNLQGLAGLLASDYWSSSGSSEVGGWVQSFDHSYQGEATKGTLYHVRPVRRF